MSDLLNPTGEPFARVMVWRSGVNDSDKGPAVWNERARASAMRIYKERGNLVLLDINHNMSEESKAARLAAGIAEEPPTAGYGRLEVDEAGSLWLVPQYSDYARSKICAKEMRYLSPEFAYDKKTREVLDIIRISLVHEPATWGARLVASAGTRKWSKSMPPEMMAALMELAALLEKEQVSDAIKTKIGEVLAMAQGGAPPSADLAADDPAKPDMLPMAALKLDPIARVRAERLALENRALCEAKIERFGADLRKSGARPLTAAEEKGLMGYSDPEQLSKAIELLSASERAKVSAPHREPSKTDPATSDEPKPKAGGYVEAVYRHYGMQVPS